MRRNNLINCKNIDFVLHLCLAPFWAPLPPCFTLMSWISVLNHALSLDFDFCAAQFGLTWFIAESLVQMNQRHQKACVWNLIFSKLFVLLFLYINQKSILQFIGQTFPGQISPMNPHHLNGKTDVIHPHFMAWMPWSFDLSWWSFIFVIDLMNLNEVHHSVSLPENYRDLQESYRRYQTVQLYYRTPKFHLDCSMSSADPKLCTSERDISYPKNVPSSFFTIGDSRT